jgi:pre-mRNA-processing factor 8
MSERVQLLLSDRVLGMTLVPEGRVWNYGIGLTQLWSANAPYSMVLDTPLLFWAEEHRPAAFLTVSLAFHRPLCVPLMYLCRSLQILKLARIRLMLRTASSDRQYFHYSSIVFSSTLYNFLRINSLFQLSCLLQDVSYTVKK